MEDSKEGWKELPISAIIDEPGSSKKFKTGDWREGVKPVVDKEKCIDCMFCWILCPDSSVIAEDEEMKGFRYEFCKGCGICANHCPVNAIEMVPEED